MNSEEGMSMAKMAVTVLLVVLVIGATVAIVYAAYSWFNSGTDNLSDKVTSISDSALSEFDDQIVSGDDVLAALKSYRNSDYCILISNLDEGCGGYKKADTKTEGKTVNCMAYCALPTDADAGVAFAAKVQKIGNSGPQWSIDSLQVDANTEQYTKNTNFSPTTTKSDKDAFVKKSADWYANIVYDKSTGEVCGLMFRQMN